MTDEARLYEFVFRGALTEEALDRSGRTTRRTGALLESELMEALPLDLFDDEYLTPAARMAVVYTAIAAFENSVRQFVAKVLIEEADAEWWDECVSDKIRKAAESRRKEEERVRWHTPRGDDLLNYTELGHLAQIIQQNWEAFEPHVRSAEWAKALFDIIERSRNVIMHSGTLEREDVERVGINMRDWLKQVGT